MVSPSTEEDWRIVQFNRRRIEREFLQQVRVVFAGQCLCLSVNKSCSLTSPTVELGGVSVVHIKSVSESEERKDILLTRG